MVRSLIAVMCGLVVCAGGASAAEVKGKVKKIDGDKITVVVAEKEQSLTLAKDVKVTELVGKGKKATPKDVEGGVKGVKEGVVVTLTTDEPGADPPRRAVAPCRAVPSPFSSVWSDPRRAPSGCKPRCPTHSYAETGRSPGTRC